MWRLLRAVTAYSAEGSCPRLEPTASNKTENRAMVSLRRTRRYLVNLHWARPQFALPKAKLCYIMSHLGEGMDEVYDSLPRWIWFHFNGTHAENSCFGAGCLV
jgi:hypothetical protein